PLPADGGAAARAVPGGTHRHGPAPPAPPVRAQRGAHGDARDAPTRPVLSERLPRRGGLSRPPGPLREHRRLRGGVRRDLGGRREERAALTYRLQLVAGPDASFFLEDWKPGGVEIAANCVGLFEAPAAAAAKARFDQTLADYGLAR